MKRTRGKLLGTGLGEYEQPFTCIFLVEMEYRAYKGMLIEDLPQNNYHSW